MMQAKFSALDVSINKFLWRDIIFEEPWWITIAEANGRMLLLTVFHDKNNPDKKSVLGFDFETQKPVWWRNNFALSEITNNHVIGNDLTLAMRSERLDLLTGQPVKDQPDLPLVRNFFVIKPLQYYPGSQHFETLKSFLEEKFRILAVSLIEYLEYESRLIISCYVNENGLANFLFVLNADGQILYSEKIDEGLKGIGVDTFFIFSGCLTFVKNKSVLVSYKMV